MVELSTLVPTPAVSDSGNTLHMNILFSSPYINKLFSWVSPTNELECLDLRYLCLVFVFLFLNYILLTSHAFATSCFISRNIYHCNKTKQDTPNPNNPTASPSYNRSIHRVDGKICWLRNLDKLFII